MLSRVASLVFAALVATGCFGSGTVGYTATATVATPDMVAVSPGVSVIADYDEPIFYSGGYYWWNADGGWYRSRSYTGGWVFVSSPPSVVARIDSPYRYRHYRPSNYTVRRRPVTIDRVERPRPRAIHRDHRSDRRDHRR